MAEGDINYASVVFKTQQNSQHQVEAKREDEIVYDEVKMQSKTTEQTANTKGLLPDEKNRSCHYPHLVCCLVIICVILLLGIIGISVYLTTFSDERGIKELELLKDNLTQTNSKLSSDNENLRMDNKNLTQAHTVLVSKVENLTAENLQLKKQNQNLETDKKNLTEQILNMETKWTELNVTRAQWSIDNYCPKGNNGRQCRPCQEGWYQSQSSCFAINNPGRPDLKTWEEARENCGGKGSDLAVAVNEADRTFIISKSWNSEGITGYWIGLRVEGGQWKWINGSDLINSSWVDAPTNGNCAVSDDKQHQKWKSVNCTEKLRWICGKKAITV
ncbi:C-type lectin domain family 10 member A-like isoform X2 [Mastacembelus armatus]|uniref:C-type lectin domain family 10 member A-like isoform X2 n=1 Tax=Mastacembelus armatus TaxID=205130 RepID=UPI000E4660D3|nr:C-type lectin domain family 10 member A-like isoform X2 [Mastacembelus armatus]